MVMSCVFFLLFFLPVALARFNAKYTKSQQVVKEDFSSLTDFHYSKAHSDLEEALTKNYSKDVRPSKQESLATIVHVYPTVNHIIEINEKQQTVRISGSLYLEWIDDYLTWNPASFGNISRFVMPSYLIWKPNLLVYNSAGRVNRSTFGVFSRTWISSNGQVIWSPLFNFEASCDFDFSAFPYDAQTCHIVVEPWSYNHQEMKFNLLDSAQISLAFNDSKSVFAGWVLQNVSTKLSWWDPMQQNFTYNKPSAADAHSYYFPVIEITPTFRRFSDYFNVGIRMPAIFTSLFTFSCFFIDDQTSRFSVLASSLLLQMLFSDDLLSILPYTTHKIPSVAKYYAVNLILTVFALVLFVAQKKLEEYAQNKNEMPGWMKRKILIGSPTTEQNIECEKMTKFARIFSVICLVLYSLVYFVSFVILIA